LRLFVIQSYVQEFIFEIIRYTIVRTRVVFEIIRYTSYVQEFIFEIIRYTIVRTRVYV